MALDYGSVVSAMNCLQEDEDISIGPRFFFLEMTSNLTNFVRRLSRPFFRIYGNRLSLPTFSSAGLLLLFNTQRNA